MNLKQTTAKTLKWNTIDRLSSQVAYAVVGIILANLLSQEDYGLVGVLSVFQAFAILFVDSGFGAALLRKKEATQTDYSTVFWFNLIVCAIVYTILFFSAPLIADFFHDSRLISLSKVLFLVFVANGLGIVQTNRLMKMMDVKQIAIGNLVSLIISGVIAVWLALDGYGAWALVWQFLTQAVIKTLWLWITGGWFPSVCFSRATMQQVWRIGMSVFSSSFLNTLCQQIYSPIIGAYYSLSSLGLYTQADKWSKMGSASISQVLTSSFVPMLARFQDDGDTFVRYVKRINRFTGFILFPVLGIAALCGSPLFHTLFGHKWDGAIILFQILCVRGIFVVLASLYNNYLLARGFGKSLVVSEAVKDGLIMVALLATVWFGSLSLLVWGQLAASVLTFGFILRITSRALGISPIGMLRDLLPFATALIIAALIAALLLLVEMPAIVTFLLTGIGCLGIYIALLALGKTPELKEGIAMIRRRFGKSAENC